MKVIAPHIKRAYLLSNLLNEYKSQVDSLGSMIMNAGFGVVLATPDCQIVYANDLAETLMRLRRGLCCRQGRISATDGKTTQKLQALISAASLPITETLSGGSMILPDQMARDYSSYMSCLFRERPATGSSPGNDSSPAFSLSIETTARPNV
jgi:hypothetical protein